MPDFVDGVSRRQTSKGSFITRRSDEVSESSQQTHSIKRSEYTILHDCFNSQGGVCRSVDCINEYAEFIY